MLECFFYESGKIAKISVTGIVVLVSVAVNKISLHFVGIINAEIFTYLLIIYLVSDYKASALQTTVWLAR